MEFIIVKLSEIAEIISGQSPPSSTYNNLGNGIPFFQGKADFGKKHPKIRNWCTKPTKTSVPNDILMSVRAPVGPVIINNIKACIGRGIGIIRVNQNISLDYIYYYLKINEEKIARLGVGSTFKAISQKDLKQLKILIPKNFEDQIHIAEILTQAENLITQRKESIVLLDELLKSTFFEMFGDPVKNEKGWSKKKLKDVCIKITDGTHFSPSIVEEGVPYITAKHVRENKIDFWAKPWFISLENHKEIFKRCTPEKGDVLYIKDGATTGYAAINKYDFEFSMLSSLALLKVNSEIVNSEYLCSWLNNEIVKVRILEGMAGGAIKRLTLTKINALPINIPSIELQNKFATIVEKVEVLKKEYESSLKELENMYGVLSQRAFKGELKSKVEVV